MATMEQAYKGKNLLIARRRLTEEETKIRLIEYYKTTSEALYAEDIANELIRSAKLTEVSTDPRGHIAIVYMGEKPNDEERSFIIIATGKTYDLVAD